MRFSNEPTVFAEQRAVHRQRTLPLTLRGWLYSVAIACCALASIASAQSPETIDESQRDAISFQVDIRPLLSDHCFQCHGPDENAREADLRLDQRDDAIADRGGYRVIHPGNIDASEFVRRILSDDEYEQMPPPSANKPLSDAQRQQLVEWVKQGAPYEPHWAFVPPSRPRLPQSDELKKFPQWGANPIDRFVLDRMLQHGLTPSETADRETLARRVSLDLIGLPPDPTTLKRFLEDSRPDAYERYVDRLLASPHYGERWARPWLDLARYSDTNGYEKDLPRSIWPFRDWVISAFNDGMPFDQFTVEQIAGDMLPNATPSQHVATGFHRNTMTNQEGGVDPQEFRFLSVVDRVSTTGTTWMGLTVGCAQCHSHKFDPISQTEYYRLFAIFNNADEPTMELHPEIVRTERTSLEKQIAKHRQDLPAQFPVEGSAEGASKQESLKAYRHAYQTWIDEVAEHVNDWHTPRPIQATSNLPIVEVLDDYSVLASGDVTKSDEFTVDISTDLPQVTAVRLEVIPDPRLPYGGPGRSSIQAGVEKGGDFYLSHFELFVLQREDDHPSAETNHVTTQRLTSQNAGEPDSRRVDQPAKAIQPAKPIAWGTATHSYAGPNRSAAAAIDGQTDTAWGVANRTAQHHYAIFVLKKPLDTSDPSVTLRFVLRHESFYPAGLGRFRISLTNDPTIHPARDRAAWVEDAIAHGTYRDQPQVDQQLREYFLDTTSLLAEARKPIASLRERLPEWPTTLVMEERADRDERVTYRHHRGEYLQPREPVEAGVPEILLHDDSLVTDRLSFARWLVSEQHPLTARVIMNRQWRQLFGRGIVKTVEDFGYQGAAPTHPELLDWLATEFMRQGWSLKSMHRLIVTSQTYRQSSRVSESQRQLDPENVWLSRSPRVRLNAEQIRDTALKAAGILCEQMTGPAVFPPQPPGITEATYSPMPWNVSTGGDRYRRGIYTFSKRTAPYAMFSLFDAPSGEACIAKRDRSNTPLQALTLLNDEVYVEAARELARSSFQADQAPNQIVTEMYLRCLQRSPDPTEAAAIIDFYQRQLDRLKRGQADADRIANTKVVDIWGVRIPKEPSALTNLDRQAVRQLASWTLVARSLMNLDEFIVRP